MQAEPLIVAWSPPELALLGSDGRLLRLKLEPAEDPAARLKELWPAEFPEEGVGRLLVPSADPDALRRFCAAARGIGTRLTGAGIWTEPVAELPDNELAERMSRAETSATLLPRGRWAFPRLPRRAALAGIAALALAAIGAAAWHVQAEAWRTQRTAADEAEHELEAAQAAAGLRRRQSAEAQEKLRRELNPPRRPVHELLLSLSSAATAAIVVDRFAARADSVRLSYHVLTAAPDAARAPRFPADFTAALQAAGVGLAGSASRAPDAPPEETWTFLLAPPPLPEAANTQDAIARLPTAGQIQLRLRPLQGEWRITAGDAVPVAPGVVARDYVFGARDLGRGAWERMVALADGMERVAGATVVAVTLDTDGSGSGAFAQAALTARLLLRAR
ncbi:MAG TPA: hypothetical protein VFE31_06275 [Opitutaceae bacterium]|jgi:hypothetical protein|nr:hypothetical protein [Opitutaceae bacterium]